MAQGFRDLKIWQTGYELVLDIYKITKKYPSEEKFGLISQTRDSSNGVIASIAEAHGRYHYADKVRVLLVSRGECEETQSHLSVAEGVGYITNTEFQSLDVRYSNLVRSVSAYIRSLRKA